jgi:trehalose/maltose hydrolase-like predicted phosphorylase/hydroxymethylpyrimidine pyrophosphatase-like HAD family hydrolase
MATTAQRATRAARAPEAAGLPDGLNRRFEAIVFDWDGTAVPDRAADARAVREAIEALCAGGMDLGVVTGTHIGNVDGQLGARPAGPGELYLCLNRGSEVFLVDETGPRLVDRRVATDAEETALDLAAETTVARLAERGVKAEIVSQRLNRRKIDVIPDPEWRDPPKAKISELLAAVEARLRAAGLDGLREAVAIAEEAARDAGLPEPKVTSDAKHVEIGLTDKADSARWIFDRLWRHGIAPSQVLVVGDEFGPLGGLSGSDSFLLPAEAEEAVPASVGREPTGVPKDVIALGGGPDAFLAVLNDQLERRRRGELPEPVQDDTWTISIRGFDPELERVHSSLLTIADGVLGTSGSPVGSHPAARPRVLAAGLYAGERAETDLVPCPTWTHLDGELPHELRFERQLDLHAGLLRQRLGRQPDLECVLFSSLARPGTVVLRALGQRALLESDRALEPAEGAEVEAGIVDGTTWMRRAAGQGGLVAAARERFDGHCLERMAAYVPDPTAVPDPEAAVRQLEEARTVGFEALLSEHRRSWAERWGTADINIEGDDELQRLVRFSLFHLMSSAAETGEAAVGARGLTGPAYRGHVFWDSDVFVLPFLAATNPAAARAMLEYRLRRLDDARAAAAALGRAGARFPWESARDGFDVTPTHAHDHSGRVVAIRTGELEEHIAADVAWAAACYVDWTGDAEFAIGPGLELFTETARYWASRIRLDGAGRGHIYGVIGPDEYHEPVDDNAFTNVMARWNLRRAAAVAQGCVPEQERQTWLRLADALVDGYEPLTQVYEQFAGFNRLEPLVVADIAHRPIAADLLLGHERTRGAQVLKQADVLMLHHLVPGEVEPESLESNLSFYEPRTAHGSSLSPAIHAALFARAGRFGPALEALRLAARIDVDDLTGTTAGGLHLATMGGVWQALVFGFAGVRASLAGLDVDPRLPDAWDALELRLRFHGYPVRIRIEHERLEVEADPAVPVSVNGWLGRRFEYQDGVWEECAV